MRRNARRLTGSNQEMRRFHQTRQRRGIKATTVVLCILVAGVAWIVLGDPYQAVLPHPVLAIILIALCFCVIAIGRLTAGIDPPGTIRPQRPYADRSPSQTVQPASEEQNTDYQHQLAVLERTSRIRPTNLLNPGETCVFYAALDAINALKPEALRWHVHAQVSMGEFIDTSFEKARFTFNSKRVDMLICNRYGLPVLVIEHQGKEHETCSKDKLRNQVKHAVLAKAGIPLLETPAGINKEAARRMIEARLRDILAVS